MRAVITGANSFIGKRLQEHLLGKNWTVVSVVRNLPDVLNPRVEYVTAAMSDYKELGKLVGECDCFVHLAWNGTRGADRMDVQKQSENIVCSLDAVHSMLESGCKKIITAGSQAEYGPHSTCISEASDCSPNTEYGKAKLKFYEEATHLCQLYDAVCIEPRFFSLYGPGDYKDTMVISTLNKLLRNEECPLTLGIQMWDYLYIDDACDALAAVCVNENIPSGVYNFGSGDVRPLKEYILEMDRLCGGNGRLRFGAVPYPPTGMVSLWPDVSKLKNTLHWEPKTSFHEGIQSILYLIKK